MPEQTERGVWSGCNILDTSTGSKKEFVKFEDKYCKVKRGAGVGVGGRGWVVKALLRIFHLYRANRSLKVGENRRTGGKTHDHP